MQMRSLTVETVFANGRRYKEEYLLRHNDHWFFMKAEREDDWLGGLRFFLNRVLYQGRNDGVSKRVYDRVIDSLDLAIGVVGEDAPLGDLKANLEPKLRERIGRGQIGRSGDIELVLSTLDFLERIGERNVVRYAIRQMKSGQVDCLFYRLIHGIRGVGPKTASLFLRDIYLLKEGELSDAFRRLEDFQFLLPVDVWVRRVVSCLGLLEYPPEKQSRGSSSLDRELRKVLAERFGRRAPLFDAGAWYTGSHEMKKYLYPGCGSGRRRG